MITKCGRNVKFVGNQQKYGLVMAGKKGEILMGWRRTLERKIFACRDFPTSIP